MAQGTAEVYQGHPTTLVLPDGKTMFCVWTLGHGGVCGPMKRSDDGGKTWSDSLATPENWTTVRNCPSLYRLSDPKGATRLFVFAGQGADGAMQQSVSTDEGKTWSPMQSNGLKCVMPFCTIVPIEGGKKLLGLTNIRRPGETKDKTSNILTQSLSEDGGRTWSPWRVILDLGELKPCEPALVRSPNGKQLLCLIRENVKHVALGMVGDDEGQTWSEAKPLPEGLFGDRHMARYAADGRLVVCFRDTGKASPTKTHFVAWVGRYEDILAGRDGQYRIKLLHSFKGGDCGYPGLELLPDGTFVATTYIKYREGEEKNSVVSTRFKLAETDKLAEKAPGTAAAKEPRVAGVLVDDSAAELTGTWVESTKQQALVGAGYRHDNRQSKTAMTAKFTPEIPKDGRYEVRLLYTATSNRATNVGVKIHSAAGEEAVSVNQKEECIANGVPRALGTFDFKAGKTGWVTVSNAGANGFVVIDGVQFVPAEIAQGERVIQADAGFPAKSVPSSTSATDRSQEESRNAKAATVALSPMAKGSGPAKTAPKSSEPVQLAKDVPSSQVSGKAYDVVVVGGTGSGVMSAVRAAREGCSVLLVQHNRHLGGMMINGLMQWDALYGGPRAPLFTELLGNIEKDAIARFGKDSKDHDIIRYTHEHYPISWAESHVAEREFNRLVAGEHRITVLLSHYPTAVQREGALLRGVTLRKYGTTEDIQVSGTTFIDATYEGDLAAMAKVPYRVGREAREEFGEAHAGKVFCNIDKAHAPTDAIEGRLNIRPYTSSQGSVDPTSPFTADGAVQAYNYRFCVTKDPANRLMVTEPPPGYDREEYLKFDRKSIATNAGPNLKSHMNSPILPGENHEYPEADWPTREKIIERHKNFGLGLIYFLQNDSSISETKKKEYLQWGLAKDEFPDNGHIPYEMYVREARRIVARKVITENDGSLAKGFARTPVFSDSIAVTDWYMDSHSCTKDSRPGFHYDGKLILTEESRPSQIPYRSLLPQGVDNLLVPVCLGATHVAWGAVRLEPVWMQTGEAAGLAAALALQQKVTPAALDTRLLLKTLVKRRHLVSFFNDVKVDAPADWIPAAEYFGTKGLIHDYNLRADEPLKKATAKIWVDAVMQLGNADLDGNEVARRVATAEQSEGGDISAGEFAALLPPPADELARAEARLTRGTALKILYALLSHPE